MRALEAIVGTMCVLWDLLQRPCSLGSLLDYAFLINPGRHRAFGS